MQIISPSIPVVVFLVLIVLLVNTVAASVEIVGTLQNVNGFALPGKVTVIQEEPHLRFTSYEVEEDGLFRFTSDSMGALVLHAVAMDHPPAEQVIAAGTTGIITVNFTLPLGQNVQVRVVDAEGKAVQGAELRVRYYEPEKFARQVSFEREDRTDGNGQILLRDVGIEVPFVVDVLVPHHLPVSSALTMLEAGETQMEDIVLGEPGATVIVELRNELDGSPVPDTWITLLADPAGLPEEHHDSWLHHRAFRQRAVSSALGNAQFTGVPLGRVLVRVKTETDVIQEWADTVSDQEHRIVLRVP